MRIAVIEHHALPSLGGIETVLNEHDVTIDTFWGEKGDHIPNRVTHDALIVLGGAMNAADDKRCPYFPALVDAIRSYTDEDKPVLGICLGAQLIARAFDADLRLDGEFEFGFHDISPTQDASEDPVLCALEHRMPLFQWHTDHYTIPRDAIRLALNDNYPNQAYRISNKTYGTQFHFEANRRLVDGWLAFNHDINDRAPGFERWLPAQFDEYEAGSMAFCRTFITNWLALAE